jgi:hypothetical protein
LPTGAAPGSRPGPNPCYKVTIGGNPADGVSVSFDRGGSYQDNRGGFGPAVFKALFKALSEYVKTLKPANISWSPVSRSSVNPKLGIVTNPEARKHVYDKWAVRNLFPDYVGMENQWIRRNIYDSEYVPNGYPPIPKDINSESPPPKKVEAIQLMRTAAEANRNEIARFADDRRRQEYERENRERSERDQRAREVRERFLRTALEDEQINPNHVQKSDIVYVVDPSNNSESSLGRIEDFSGSSAEDFKADVEFAINDEDDFTAHRGYRHHVSIKLNRLKKETPAGLAERQHVRQQAIIAAINDPQKNPNRVNEGDNVITHIGENPTSEQNGLLGKITQLILDNGTLKAKVDWDEHAKQILGYRSTTPIHITFLYKATPEEQERIQKIRRDHEVEQQIQTNRERRQAQSQVQAGAEFLNHPNNPEHFIPGDHVIVNDYGTSHKGVIDFIKQDQYNPEQLMATVRHRTNNSLRRWVLSRLSRDTSEEAITRQQRMQQRQQRQQRLSGTGYNIGDNVTVTGGLNRGKSGRIIDFRASGENISAIIGGPHGNFTASIRYLSSVSTESFYYFLLKHGQEFI